MRLSGILGTHYYIALSNKLTRKQGSRFPYCAQFAFSWLSRHPHNARSTFAEPYHTSKAFTRAL
jgi:hypothetical protein